MCWHYNRRFPNRVVLDQIVLNSNANYPNLTPTMLEKVPTAKSSFELEEIDGELLLYSPESTRSIYMNSTASIIWRLCDGKLTVGEIVELLKEAFPDAVDSIEQDVVGSIELFISNNAIEFSE